MDRMRIAESGRGTDRRPAGSAPPAAMRPPASLAAQGATIRPSTHIAASLGPGFAPTAAHRSAGAAGVAGVAKPALMSVSRIFAASIVPRPVPRPSADSSAAVPIRKPLPVVPVSRGSSVLEAVRHAAPAATANANAAASASTSGHKRPRLQSASALLLATAVEDGDGPPSSKHRRIDASSKCSDDEEDEDPIASGSDRGSVGSDDGRSSCSDDGEAGCGTLTGRGSAAASSDFGSSGYATLSALFAEADAAEAAAAAAAAAQASGVSASSASSSTAAAAASMMDDLLSMMRQEKEVEAAAAPQHHHHHQQQLLLRTATTSGGGGGGGRVRTPARPAASASPSSDVVLIDDDDSDDGDADADADDEGDDDEDDDESRFGAMPPLTMSVPRWAGAAAAATGGASSSSSSRAVGGGAASSASSTRGGTGRVQPVIESSSSRRSASTASAFSAASSASSASTASSSLLSMCAASLVQETARASGSGAGSRSAGAVAAAGGTSDDSDAFEEFLLIDATSSGNSSASEEDDDAGDSSGSEESEDETTVAAAEASVLRRFACTCRPRGAVPSEAAEDSDDAVATSAGAAAPSWSSSSSSSPPSSSSSSPPSSSSSSVAVVPRPSAICRACLAVRIRRVYMQFCAIEREWAETAPIKVFNHTKKCLNDGCGVEGANRPGTMHPAPLAVAMIASGLCSSSRLYDVGAGWGQAMALASAFTGCLADGDELHTERTTKGHAVIAATCKCLGALTHAPAGLGCAADACKAMHTKSRIAARGRLGFERWQAAMAEQAGGGSSSSSSSAAASARVSSVHQSLAVLQKTTLDASPAARAERDDLERFVMGLTPAKLQIGASADLKVQQKLMLQLAKVLMLGRNRDTALEARREPICELLSLRAGDVLHAQRKCKSTLSLASVVLINNWDNAWQENGSTVQNRVMRLLARVLPRGAIVISLSPFTRLSTRRTRTSMKNTALIVAGSSYSVPSMYFEVCSGWPALDPDLCAAEAAFLSENGVPFTSKDSAEWAFPEEFLETNAFDSWVDAVFDGGKSMPTMAAVTHMLEHVCKPCDRSFSVE